MAKGFKTCQNPACRIEVAGPRTKVCPECKHPFEFDTGTPTIPIINEKGEQVLVDATRTVFTLPDGYDYPDHELLYVHTPAGECPVKLKADDGETFPGDDTLREWAGNTRQYMITRYGQYLKNEALIYWARQQLNARSDFAPRGDEMIYVGLILDEMPDIVTKQIPV